MQRQEKKVQSVGILEIFYHMLSINGKDIQSERNTLI